MINKSFMEIMIEGDMIGRGFQHPIPIYIIIKYFDWDEKTENNKHLFEMIDNYSFPHFFNNANSDIKPSLLYV